MIIISVDADIAWWQSAILMIEGMWVWVPAGAVGEFSSPELTFCADSYSVSIQSCITAVACKRSRSFCQSAGGRLCLNTHTPLTQWSQSRLTILSRHSVRIYQGKWAHTQLIRKHLTKVVLACWATVGWSWPKKGNWCTQVISMLKKKKARVGNESSNLPT